MKKLVAGLVMAVALVGCTEVKSGQTHKDVMGDVYELEIPGLNIKVVEFTPKNAKDMLCVAVARNDQSAAITCFKKEL